MQVGAALNRYGLDKGCCVKTHVFDGVHMRFLISVFVDSGYTKQTRNRLQVGGGIKSNMVCIKGAV